MKNNIWRITLDTNPEDCNLHCIMCEEHSKYSTFKEKLFQNKDAKHRRMPEFLIEKLMKEAATLGVREIIPTTMGDPFVSSSFEKIAKLAKLFNIRMNVTHNGTFPGKPVKEWAEIIIPHTTDIKISWNGFTKSTAEAIMEGIDYDIALKNLKEFIGFRNEWHRETGYYCRVSFQMTFMRNNMHEVNDVIRLAAEIGVDRIKGHHLWVHFPELKKLSFANNKDTIEAWNEIVKEAHKTADTIRERTGKTVLLENFIPMSDTAENQIPDNYECPFLGKELWLSATGEISPCCAPDDKRRALGNFGNAHEIGLVEVLNSEKYNNLINNYKKHELCRKCNMRKPQI